MAGHWLRKRAFEKDELHCRDELVGWEYVVRNTGKAPVLWVD